MRLGLLVALTVAFVGPSGVVAEEPAKKDDRPPYQRLLQGDDAAAAAKLQRRVDELGGTDRWAEAADAAEELLALRVRVQGADHHETVSQRHAAGALRALAALTDVQRAAWRQAMAGQHQAGQLEARGRYREALPLRQAAAETCRALLGADHLQTAATFSSLATSLVALGQHAQALPLVRQTLAIRRRALGDDHPDTAGAYNNLAAVLHAQGKAVEARPLLEKALAIRRRALGDDHPDTARSHGALGAILYEQGQYAEAVPPLQKALEVSRRTRGEGHPDTARDSLNLAVALNALGRSAEAEALNRRALAIRRRALGDGHPDTANAYNNLATTLVAQGQYAAALPLVQRALSVTRRALGDDHPATANACNNLAFTLEAQGRHAEAEPFYRLALDVKRRTLGADHPDTATSINNLAANLNTQGKRVEALPAYREALDVRRRVLGEAHPDTATSYNNLAYSLHEQGKHAEAAPLFEKALAIRRRALGAGHPLTVQVSQNLALSLAARRRHAEARPLYEAALAGWRRARGEGHPDTALAHDNLAANLAAQGQYAEAEASAGRAAAAYEAARLGVAGRGLDRAAFSERSPYCLLAALRARLNRPAEAWAALEADLARGLRDEAAARRRASLAPDAARRREDGAARLAALRPRLLALVTRQDPTEAEAADRDRLLAERAALEKDLADLAVTLSRKEVADLDAARAALPADAALVAWIDLRGNGGDLQEHWGCVLRRTGPPAWVPLPPGGPDDALPARLRAALWRQADGPDGRAAELARGLAARRLAPLRPHLGGVRHLFVAPVGVMAGVPVGALTEDFTVSYVPSATELARLRAAPRPAAGRLLALADPAVAPPEAAPKDSPLPEHGLLLTRVQPGGPAQRGGLKAGDVLLTYGGQKLTALERFQVKAAGDDVPVELWRDGRTLTLTVSVGPLGVGLDRRPAPEALRARREADRQLASATRGPALPPLPGTRREVEALARLFPAADVLQGPDASEQRLDGLLGLKGLAGYSHLHFATHGVANTAQAFESALVLAHDALPDNAERVAQGLRPIDGRLTAREVLDDWKLNADLVVLSACESGLGKSGGGDGLLGFAQAFLLAGTRSVVLSLWPVDDTATALLMQRFYQNLLGKRQGLKAPLPKAEALREAQEWLRGLTREQVEAEVKQLPVERGGVRSKPAAAAVADRPFAHPHYWAAFVLIGDPL